METTVMNVAVYAWNLGSAGGISFGLYCEIK